MSKKRNRFDPEAVRSKIKKRKTILSEVKELGNRFIAEVNNLIETSINHDLEWITDEALDDPIIELIVIASLGLKGCETLRFVYNHIPANYGNRKPLYAGKILEQVCERRPINFAVCKGFTSILQVNS